MNICSDCHVCLYLFKGSSRRVSTTSSMLNKLPDHHYPASGGGRIYYTRQVQRLNIVLCRQNPVHSVSCTCWSFPSCKSPFLLFNSSPSTVAPPSPLASSSSRDSPEGPGVSCPFSRSPGVLAFPGLRTVVRSSVYRRMKSAMFREGSRYREEKGVSIRTQNETRAQNRRHDEPDRADRARERVDHFRALHRVGDVLEREHVLAERRGRRVDARCQARDRADLLAQCLQRIDAIKKE